MAYEINSPMPLKSTKLLSKTNSMKRNSKNEVFEIDIFLKIKLKDKNSNEHIKKRNFDSIS